MPEPIPLHPFICLLPTEQVALSLPHAQCDGFICIKPCFSKVLLVPTIPLTVMSELQNIKKKEKKQKLVEPSKSKSKVKRILKDSNSKTQKKEEGLFPFSGPLCGQVAAREKIQDQSPAMAQENATKGQKDAKSDDEIK